MYQLEFLMDFQSKAGESDTYQCKSYGTAGELQNHIPHLRIDSISILKWVEGLSNVYETCNLLECLYLGKHLMPKQGHVVVIEQGDEG